MKDMYSFDVSEEAAHHTYQSVCQAYGRLFDRLGLRWVQVGVWVVECSHDNCFNIQSEKAQLGLSQSNLTHIRFSRVQGQTVKFKSQDKVKMSSTPPVHPFYSILLS